MQTVVGCQVGHDLGELVRKALRLLEAARGDVEGSFAPPGSYVEPFATRALGVTTGDDELLRRADERFRALGLVWHADQTEPLRRLRKLALG